jgi:GTP-binding protein
MTSTAPPAKASKAPTTAFTVVDASFLAGAPHVSSLPAPALAELAFAGRSNVGKSSLLNAMMQRRGLARTSSTPGCTRQLNVFGVTLNDGLTVHFVDLPGYGYAKVSKSTKIEWGPMLEGYLLERPTLRAVCVLVDVRRGVEEDDRQLLEFLAQPRHVNENKPVDRIVVVTKVDKLPLNKRKTTLAQIQKDAGVPVIGFSAETGDGREELWKRLRRSL